MSEYRRWISYIYSYENGHKKQNAGYARIESRDGKVRITIHFNPGRRDGSVTVCYYKNQPGQLDGVVLGEMSLAAPSPEFRSETEAADLMGSGLMFAEINGLLLYHEGGYYASSWEEDSLSEEVAEAIINHLEGDAGMPEADGEEENAEEDQQGAEEENIVEESAEEDTNMVQDERVEDILISPEPTERYEPEQPASNETEKPKKPEEHVDKVVQASADAGSKAGIPRQERAYHCLEQMYPFEDGELEQCVRMEPQDCGLLPPQYWKMAGNSFLLHGFYTYHHLLLAKKREKEGSSHYLMIPGIFQKQDQHMASMFGFRGFKAARKKRLETGDFGYWYMELHLDGSNSLQG